MDCIIMNIMQMQSQEMAIQGNKSSEQFQILEDCDSQKQLENQQPTGLSISYYSCGLVIDKSIINKQFESEDEWRDLLGKKFEERLFDMSFIAINSIVNIVGIDNPRRLSIWESVLKEMKLNQKEQEESLEENLKVRKEIHENVQRIWKRFTKAEKEEYDQYKESIESIVYVYQRREGNLSFHKGLENICLGIMICNPKKDVSLSKKIFIYIMEILNIKNIYYPATPLYYSQVDSLVKEIAASATELYTRLQNCGCDWNKLFLSYYRTLMLNRIKCPQVIAIIIDLVLVFGIGIIKIMLTRILVLNQNKLMEIADSDELMNIMGLKLLEDALELGSISKIRQNASTEKSLEEGEINKKMKQLIIGS